MICCTLYGIDRWTSYYFKPQIGQTNKGLCQGKNPNTLNIGFGPFGIIIARVDGNFSRANPNYSQSKPRGNRTKRNPKLPGKCAD